MSNQKVHKVYLGLGSNLGDRMQNILNAIAGMDDYGIKVTSLSGFYKSKPWGYSSSNLFYNLCLMANTFIEPESLLAVIKQIEKSMGRVHRSGEYTDRSIDIDILFYDQLVMKSDLLTIPHPQLTRRAFVLKPLAEIEPDLMHPVYHKTMMELLNDCEDRGMVQPLD